LKFRIYMYNFKTNLQKSLKHTNITAVPLSDYGCKKLDNESVE